MSERQSQRQLREEDARARRIAQREFRAPLVLEAGAGTGKTATLVARVLAWSLGEGWDRAANALRDSGETEPQRVAARVLERVVAITFTDAAAAEMAERVERGLAAVEAGQPLVGRDADLGPNPETASARARALRFAVDRLRVQTIHAWCRSLLGAHPIDASLHPHFVVDADGRLHRALVREVLDEQLRRAYEPPVDPAHLALAECGVGPGEIEEALVALSASGVTTRAFDPDPLAPERMRALRDDFSRAVRGAVAAAGDALLAVNARSSQTLAAARALESTGEHLEGPGGAADLAALGTWLGTRWEKRDVERLRKWARGDFTASEQGALESRAHALEAAAAPLAPLLEGLMALDVRALELEHRVVRDALCEIERRARARGFVTFDGLLESCVRLLRDSPQVASRLRREIDQLLVDEFQDTDARQCEIVATFALAGPQQERPGLFLVGDPKQSIYGWRSADLAAYEDFRDRVVDEGGEVFALCVNHRSVPAVLDEVERVVAPVMLRQPRLQPAFQPLVASGPLAQDAGFRGAGRRPVEHWLSARWDSALSGLAATSASEATRIEARALARDVRHLHEECGVDWRDVGILFRSRGEWEIYLGALREEGVPFSVEGDRSYFRRREVIDAAALVRCVIDPGDVLALLTVMRSPAVGVPDAALGPLFTRDFPARVSDLSRPARREQLALKRMSAEIAASLPADVPGLEQIEGWHINLDALVASVAELRRSWLTDPADRFVERLRTVTLVEAGEAGRFLGAWRAANLERFFHDLATRLADGASEAEVLRELRRAVAEEEPREEGRLRDLEPEAVRVLTLHGAKGLAFEHVYLMQLHKGTGGGADRGVAARTVDGRLEYRLQASASLAWYRAEAERGRVAEAERVRTLYVGMTRARRRLVLAGLPREQAQRTGRDGHAELLERRDPPRPELADLAGRCTAAGGDRVELADAMWVLPAVAQEGRAGRGHRAHRAPLDLGRIRSDAERLAAATADAALRMARPLGTTASDAVDHGIAAPDGERAAEPAPELHERADPDLARAVGTVIHGVLERIDLEDAKLDALARARVDVETQLSLLLPARRVAAALAETDAALDRIAGGALLERLFALGDHVLARELPVLLAPAADDAAVGFVSGAIDLLYRDPSDGALVVVDFKTDRLRDAAAFELRAREYAAQGEVYVRAVHEALGLEAAPRFELWFLAHDRCVAPARSHGGAIQLSFALGASSA